MNKAIDNEKRQQRTLELIRACWKTRPEMQLGELVTYLAKGTGSATVTDKQLGEEIMKVLNNDGEYGRYE